MLVRTSSVIGRKGDKDVQRHDATSGWMVWSGYGSGWCFHDAMHRACSVLYDHLSLVCILTIGSDVALAWAGLDGGLQWIVASSPDPSASPDFPPQPSRHSNRECTDWHTVQTQSGPIALIMVRFIARSPCRLISHSLPLSFS